MVVSVVGYCTTRPSDPEEDSLVQDAPQTFAHIIGTEEGKPKAGRKKWTNIMWNLEATLAMSQNVKVYTKNPDIRQLVSSNAKVHSVDACNRSAGKPTGLSSKTNCLKVNLENCSTTQLQITRRNVHTQRRIRNCVEKFHWTVKIIITTIIIVER